MTDSERLRRVLIVEVEKALQETIRRRQHLEDLLDELRDQGETTGPPRDPPPPPKADSKAPGRPIK